MTKPATQQPEPAPAATRRGGRRTFIGMLALDVGLPLDPGTRRVVTDGLRVLHDPDRRLAALAVAASQP